MRALVVIFLLVFGGAVALGGLIVDGKPLESSKAKYEAIATATWSAQNALNDRSRYEETITPRAASVQFKATLLVQSAEQTVTTAAMRAQGSSTAEARRAEASATAEAQKAQESAFAYSIAVTQTLMAHEDAVNQAHASETARAISLQKRAQEAEATRVALARNETKVEKETQATLAHIAEAPRLEAEARNRQETFENLLSGALVLGIALLAGGLLYVLLKFARALEQPMATPEAGGPSEERQAPKPEPARGIVVLPKRHEPQQDEQRRRAA